MKIDPELLEDKEPSYTRKKMKKVGIKTGKAQTEGLQEGRVIFLTPDAIHVYHDKEIHNCTLKGNLKKELKANRNRLACGDLVDFDPEKKVIVALKDRKTVLMRQNPSNKFKEQILATNIDLLLITASVVEPKINPYLLDLYLIAAQRSGLKPVILINKVDLLKCKKQPARAKGEKKLLDALKEQYKNLGIPILEVSALSLDGFKELHELMKDQACVFSGESGVGKSSLINSLEQSRLKVSEVSAKSKGTHTTTSSMLLQLKSGGWCVDTPGIQSLGFKDLKAEEVKYFFPEFASLECKFANCIHQNEKGCALKDAVENNTVSKHRLDSYLRILDELGSKH